MKIIKIIIIPTATMNTAMLKPEWLGSPPVQGWKCQENPCDKRRL
jgi:hypothetical protein